ncbi:serine hydrolase domain-containing protein [Nibrella saemangeumensis]
MRPLHHSALLFFLFLFIPPVQADDLDEFIRQQLRKRNIPGLSLAIIQDGKIVKAKAYGFTDKSGTTPLTTATLFQAGSISKSVAAMGALHLVEAGHLSLDEDVNTKLRSWKVPNNEFTRDKKVTLRGLLSHTTGLTVHGFPGYEAGSPLPTLVQILDGTPPANTAPVRVNFEPGTQWRYSGGGYTVMQLLMEDVTGRPFPAFMQEAVLEPLGMTGSTYAQPLPADKAAITATGHLRDRQLVNGRWHIYPEMAAAGLWTTPTDLARFAISIQNSFAGKPVGVITQQMTQQMLTDQKNNDGLGVFLEGEGASMRFGHNGRDEGFDALMTAGVESGQGAVIMINANDNSRMLSRIQDAIAKEYHWAGYADPAPAKPTAIRINPSELLAFEGRYELFNNQMITFVAGKDRLVTLSDGFPDEEFVPETPTQFVSTDRNVQVTFIPGEKGEMREVIWKNGRGERKAPRIGPLLHTLKPGADPDPARTRQIETALKAISQGGTTLEKTSGITPGARKDFAGGTRELTGLKSLTYIHAENTTGRGIERHQSPVDQVIAYKLQTGTGQRYAIVHLTPDGQVTDYDVVDK